jgi:transaldolase
MRGIERRVAANLDPKVNSVASLFVSRWDVAVKGKVAHELENRLGIAVAQRTYKSYCDVLASPRWQALSDSGAVPQRLLWASTGTKDPKAPDTLYVQALAAPDTINTIPDKTLLAFAEHGMVKGVLPKDGGDCETVLSRFKQAGIDQTALAAQLQAEGTQSFDTSWSQLLACIASKCEELKRLSSAGVLK